MSFNVDGLNYCPLAHQIVRETECTYCGAKKGQRCITKRVSYEWPFGRVLPPCDSHRNRIETWHLDNPIVINVEIKD